MTVHRKMFRMCAWQFQVTGIWQTCAKSHSLYPAASAHLNAWAWQVMVSRVLSKKSRGGMHTYAESSSL